MTFSYNFSLLSLSAESAGSYLPEIEPVAGEE